MPSFFTILIKSYQDISFLWHIIQFNALSYITHKYKITM
uniref:Uncharacterized protein n=1 Tax=Lepeophtheirus salmonis TaxID=72036 RepID=A0A0K2TYF8_LEPSM